MNSKTQKYATALGQYYDTDNSPIPLLSCWRHYKGGVYQIRNFCISDGNVNVIYSRVDGENYNPFKEADITFTRPASEWFTMIDDNTQRFVRVTKKVITTWVEV